MIDEQSDVSVQPEINRHNILSIKDLGRVHRPPVVSVEVPRRQEVASHVHSIALVPA
jgi:hypothetical protein